VLGLFLTFAGASGVAFALTMAFRMPWWGGLIWGVGGFVVGFFLLTKKVLGRLEGELKGVEEAVSSGKVDKATAVLRGAFRFSKWHPLIGSQLHAQMGALLYVQDKVDEALPHLRAATTRSWVGQAMLGCAYFKKKDKDAMVATFEGLLKRAPKEGLAWTVYAYCLRELVDRASAVSALERGVAAAPQDQRLATNLERTKGGKKLKVEPYGAQWSQFKLGPPLRMVPGPGDPQMSHPALRGLRRGRR
jgi:hypothetical protein